MRDRKPIPKNQSQVIQEALPPAYLAIQGKPPADGVFTKNRAYETSRKNDKIKDINVGLEDIDYAIKYYFDNVIKPTVVLDGQLHAVSTIYASPERWQSVQADGYYRDTNGKLTVPLIIYKRTNVEKNRTLGNKIDGNNVSLFQLFPSRYNAKNFYDSFSVLTNRKPSQQYYMSVVPDYVTVTYDVVVFTNYVAENNKIIEAIEFASDSYWGDKNRWHFRTMLDNLATTTTINTGEDRFAQTTITLRVNGYLIPDSINKKLANSSLGYTTSQVVFGLETVENVNAGYSPTSQITSAQSAGATSFIGSGTGDIATFSAPSPLITGQSLMMSSFVGDGLNVTNEYQNYTGLTPEDLAYITVSITKVANTVTTSTATFNGASFLEPSVGSQLPPTSISNFSFYVNGLAVTNDSLVGFGSDGMGNLILTLNIANLGYSLISTDEVTAIGKFA
jgi:hypothetical protein